MSTVSKSKSRNRKRLQSKEKTKTETDQKEPDLQISTSESKTESTNIVKPLEQWTKEEVKAWFEENEFSEYYKPFEKLSGKHLLLLSENNVISKFGPILGGVIYNAIQKLKTPTSPSFGMGILGESGLKLQKNVKSS